MKKQTTDPATAAIPAAQLAAEKAELERIEKAATKDAPPAKAKAVSKERRKAMVKTNKAKKTAKAKRRPVDENEKEEANKESLKALQKAKPIYKQRGDVNHCGDWLALTLKEAYKTDEDGEMVFDIDGFTHCLKDNDIEVKGPWATNRSKGWQGRFRMNGRQKLEIVALQGHLKISGKKTTVPPKALALLKKKHGGGK